MPRTSGTPWADRRAGRRGSRADCRGLRLRLRAIRTLPRRFARHTPVLRNTPRRPQAPPPLPLGGCGAAAAAAPCARRPPRTPPAVHGRRPCGPGCGRSRAPEAGPGGPDTASPRIPVARASVEAEAAPPPRRDARKGFRSSEGSSARPGPLTSRGAVPATPSRQWNRPIGRPAARSPVSDGAVRRVASSARSHRRAGCALLIESPVREPSKALGR